MINVSNFVEAIANKPVAVFGLGVSGLATIKALAAAGAKIYVQDDNPEALPHAIKAGGEVKEFTKELLENCACLVLAPGVPLHFPEPHPVVNSALEADIEIICDIEILHHCNHGIKTIGVTGTNGKSTATALIAHILNESGMEAVAAGNIGKPVLDLELPGKDGALVLEISSYQMDLCPTFRPDIGVMLDITPDHIDRHGSFEAYKEAKMRMLEGVDTVIIEGDTHLAAAKVAKEFGISDEQIDAAIKNFKGLPHRQQFIRQINNVSYINDSKATNPESCIFALKKFEQIYLILGGQAKDSGLSGIEKFKDKISHVFLIGKDMGPFSEWLAGKQIPYTPCGTLEAATREAHKMAQENGEGTVLLSPACASFDQFTSFEDRGECFMVFVNAL